MPEELEQLNAVEEPSTPEVDSSFPDSSMDTLTFR